MGGVTLRQTVRAYGWSIAIWCGLSLLVGWNYRVYDQYLNNHTSLLDMVLLAESHGLAFGLLTPPIFYLVRRYLNRSGHTFWYLSAYALGLGPFLVLYACIRWVVQPPWDAALQQYVPRSAHGPFYLIRTGFADQVTMYLAIVVAAHAYEYFSRVRRQELERYEFQQALAASELQALKMQLHPHFLFNTLHGISTLIDSDHKRAKAMLIKLSSLLRTALLHSGSDLITLEEEMRFIREYLDLEKMRFGPRLTVTWSIAADTSEVLVPQLILQPLVENAIRHGIASSREKGWVEIDSRRSGDRVELRISNSLGGRRPQGTGVGLRNTESRLRHLYSGEASFCFALTEETATATVVVPALGMQQRGSEAPRATGVPARDWPAVPPEPSQSAGTRSSDGMQES